MNWTSWSDFAAMGGYANYVWGSFGMCALIVIVEVLGLAQKRRGLRRDALAGTDVQPRGASS
jgi:heme exporter protein D